MKNNIYLIITTFLVVTIQAQSYTWQWAKTGGGTNGSSGSGFSQTADEQVLDMVVDQENNTYYLVPLQDGSPLYDAQAVTHYDDRDLMLFSTDCQGNLRWKTTIGGYGDTGQSQKIVLDNNGGLYMSITIGNISTNISTIPTKFDDTNALPFQNSDPFLAEAAKRYGFLLKYDTSNGNLLWRNDFQGDVSVFNSNIDISPAVIDSQNNIHLILGFKYGTHLNGMITVPNTYDENTLNFQYFLVKYDTNGNIVGTPVLLPMEGSTTFLGGYLQFLYDEANSRYYLAGARNYDGGGQKLYHLVIIPL